MLRWNTFAMNYTPKNLSDSVKCQELLNGFIHKYRIFDPNIDSPDEMPKVKRLMIASLLQRLYQNSLISVECVVSSLEQFQE
ncbi:hypothetical protein FGO68_gene11781 [Halteria grandinella]|uniref:Uncharacterized protein n=1 Tax=Halteria grandinella TaxID=5974 RepID=A0A8J8NPT8_HALGN|nr:hypothetical protein FGO68_gene11781 [Halteria grandinella]